MRNFLFAIVISFFALSANADNKLNYYSCTQGANLETCSGCIKSKLQISYKVQPINNVVIATTYDNGKMVRSNSLDNCKVVNESNWECENNISTDRMINGILIHSSINGVGCGKSGSVFNFLN